MCGVFYAVVVLVLVLVCRFRGKGQRLCGVRSAIGISLVRASCEEGFSWLSGLESESCVSYQSWK